MIRAIVWKEFREQGIIGLTLVVLGTGVLVAAATLADPPVPSATPTDVVRYLGAGRLATLLLAVTAGMVCGGALFAAEREAGTMGFLESLPVSRAELWQTKLAAGLALVVLQVGAVVGVAACLGLVGSTGWGLEIVLYAVQAFGWGAYGSALARTTLGAVGVAIPVGALCAFVFLVPILIFFRHPGTNLPQFEGWLLFRFLMIATPVGLSALAFTRQDRERLADDRSPAARSVALQADETPEPAAERVAPESSTRTRLGLKALLWLSGRQLLYPGAVISAFALVFGCVLLLPAIQPILLWPALALTAGVLAGVTVFADEQAHGVARFWGERRLPIGRLWLVKVGTHAAFALWVALLLALPLAIRSQAVAGAPGQWDASLSAVFRSLLFEERNLGLQAWKYLLTPLVYGFAVGHLCGLLFRKTVVAAGVAGLVGGTGASLWVPSLLAGGVWHWQLWLPPALTLITARLLLRAWSADRLAYRVPLTALVTGTSLSILTLAAGIGYRVVEIPDERGAEEDIRYVAGLVQFDSNEAGRWFRTAAEQYARIAGLGAPGVDRGAGTTARRNRMEDSVERIPIYGFSANDLEVNAWLAHVYSVDFPHAVEGREAPWYTLAEMAARLPTGLFEHPQITSTATDKITLENGRRMAVVILAHGLQQQAAGDPAALASDLRTVLALGRNMRNGSIVVALMQGTAVTRTALMATDRWLEQLRGRPDLLRAALDAVLEDERALPTRILSDGQVLRAEIPKDDLQIPFDPTPHLLAEQYVVREMMKAPNQWLPEQITPMGGDREVTTPVTDLVSFAWSVWWERERTRRLVGLGIETGNGPKYHRLARGRPGAALLTVRVPAAADLVNLDKELRVYRRAIAIKLAVRLYMAEKGATPADLSSLVVAGYLPHAPIDPYSDRPFQYRVSPGEFFGPPLRGMGGASIGPTPTVAVSQAKPGQPVIWSVGPDVKDQGGRSLPLVPGNPSRAEDLVFLVPLPPDPQ